MEILPYEPMRHLSVQQIRLAVAQAQQETGFVSPLVESVRAVLSERPRLAAAVAGVACTYAVWRSIRKPLWRKWRDIQHAIHGTVPFEGESMQEGSELDESGEAESPPSQINLYAKGLFTTSFLGCGARLQSYLVTPWHVVRGCGTIIAENPASRIRMEVPVRFMRSKAIQDMCYFQCPASWWSQLGTKTGPSKTLPEALAMKSTPAVVVSRDMASAGSIQPLPLSMYKVSYTGSTVAGFSGALYVSGGRVLGMHQGTQGSKNIGFLWEAIVTDVCYMFNEPAVQVQGEGKFRRNQKASGAGTYPLGEDGKLGVEAPQSKTMWGYGDVRQQIERAYAVVDSGWADDCEIDYNAQLQFENNKNVDGVVIDMCDNLADLTPSHLEAVIARAQAEIKRKSVIAGQNGEGTTVEGGSTLFGQMLVTAKETAKVLIEERVRPLEARVVSLEQASRGEPKTVGEASPKAPPRKGVEKIKCDKCSRSFVTQIGLMQHKKMFVHGEGRRPTPFLGTQKPSTSSQGLKSLNTSAKGIKPSQPRESPQSTPDIQKEFGGILEKILEAISGLKQEPVPNSKA